MEQNMKQDITTNEQKNREKIGPGIEKLCTRLFKGKALTSAGSGNYWKGDWISDVSGFLSHESGQEILLPVGEDSDGLEIWTHIDPDTFCRSSPYGFVDENVVYHTIYENDVIRFRTTDSDRGGLDIYFDGYVYCGNAVINALAANGKRQTVVPVNGWFVALMDGYKKPFLAEDFEFRVFSLGAVLLGGPINPALSLSKARPSRPFEILGNLHDDKYKF